MIFIVAVVLCICLSILNYFEFDWVMRFAKTNFKRYPIKVQRIVFSCLGSVAVIPIAILKIVNPATENIYYFYAVIANLVVLTIYILTMRGVSQQAIKIEEAKENIIELKLQNTDDLLLIKKELKSWYDISISTKQIEKILEKIQNEKNLKE